MNCVLERRKGLPITLSLVYMEVAKQLGLSMRGVQLPAHFMIAPEDQDLEILVDPFNGVRCVTMPASSLMDPHRNLDPSGLPKELCSHMGAYPLYAPYVTMIPASGGLFGMRKPAAAPTLHVLAAACWPVTVVLHAIQVPKQRAFASNQRNRRMGKASSAIAQKALVQPMRLALLACCEWSRTLIAQPICCMGIAGKIRDAPLKSSVPVWDPREWREPWSVAHL